MKNPLAESKKFGVIKLHKIIPNGGKIIEELEDGTSARETMSFNYSASLIDRESSTKLYKEEQFKELLSQLSGNASKLLLYITMKLPKNKDLVTLPFDKVMEAIGIKSKTTYYKILDDLVQLRIILRHKKDKFWVNPHYIFNGDRVKYFFENHNDLIEIKAEIGSKLPSLIPTNLLENEETED